MRDERYLHFMPGIRNVAEQPNLIADETIESVLLVGQIPHILVILGLDDSVVACTIKAQEKHSERQAKNVHHLKRCLWYKNFDGGVKLVLCVKKRTRKTKLTKTGPSSPSVWIR